MKFNDLTIRELRAQAIAACRKVVARLSEDKKAKYDFLTVDFIDPMAIEDDEMEDFEYFTVLGRVWLIDKTKLSFRAALVWHGDDCALMGPDSVEFIDVDIESLGLQ
jgi:hypothetical protein